MPFGLGQCAAQGRTCIQNKREGRELGMWSKLLAGPLGIQDVQRCQDRWWGSVGDSGWLPGRTHELTYERYATHWLAPWPDARAHVGDVHVHRSCVGVSGQSWCLFVWLPRSGARRRWMQMYVRGRARALSISSSSHHSISQNESVWFSSLRYANLLLPGRRKPRAMPSTFSVFHGHSHLDNHVLPPPRNLRRP
jgi:hypothetical protein